MYSYVMVFSSFYKASYAQEKLSADGVRSGLMRVPPGLINSCGYGLYLKEKDLKPAKKTLENAGIRWSGLYRIEGQNYIRI